MADAKEQDERSGYPFAPAAVELREIDRLGARSVLTGQPLEGCRWAKDYPAAGDIEAAQLLLQRIREGGELHPFGMYEIIEVASATVIGGIGFHRPPDRDGVVEVGYGIVPSRWGNGFGTEALEEAVELAQRNGARVVTARTLPANLPSRRVLEKAGFHLANVADGFVTYEIDVGP